MLSSRCHAIFNTLSILVPDRTGYSHLTSYMGKMRQKQGKGSSWKLQGDRMCQGHWPSSNQTCPIKQLQKLGNAPLPEDLHVATSDLQAKPGRTRGGRAERQDWAGQPVLGLCVGWRAGQGGDGAAHQGVLLLPASSPYSKPG